MPRLSPPQACGGNPGAFRVCPVTFHGVEGGVVEPTAVAGVLCLLPAPHSVDIVVSPLFY